MSVAGARPLNGRLVADEEKKLVLDDRPAQRAAEHMHARCALALAGREEIIARAHLRVDRVLECRSFEDVGAALHLHVHGSRARHPLVGIEAARHDIDGFNRLEAGPVTLDALEKLVRGRDAVETDDGVGRRLTVDGERHGAARIVDAARLLIARIGHTRHEREEALKRAAAGRERLKLLGGRKVLHRGILRLQNGGRRRDGNRLLERAEAELRIHAHVAIGHRDLASREGLKSGEGNRDGISA